MPLALAPCVSVCQCACLRCRLELGSCLVFAAQCEEATAHTHVRFRCFAWLLLRLTPLLLVPQCRRLSASACGAPSLRCCAPRAAPPKNVSHAALTHTRMPLLRPFRFRPLRAPRRALRRARARPRLLTVAGTPPPNARPVTALPLRRPVRRCAARPLGPAACWAPCLAAQSIRSAKSCCARRRRSARSRRGAGRHRTRK